MEPGTVSERGGPEEIEVVGEPSPDEGSVYGDLTVVRVDRSLGDQADLGDALERVPGAMVRRLGGLGDFASVSFRGAQSRQIEVLLDGVPLNPEGSGAFDLSGLPLRAFGWVGAWRGLAPIGLGADAMGGVVELEPQSGGRFVEMGSSGGSWGTARVWLSGAAPTGPVDWAGYGEALASQGDFVAFSDGGTVHTRTDDRFVVRNNHDKAQGSALVRASWGDSASRWSVVDAALVRDAGVPGPLAWPTAAVRYVGGRNLVGLHGEFVGERTRGDLVGYSVVRDERVDDPLGELGLGPKSEGTFTTSHGLRGTVDREVLGPLRARATVSARHDGVVGRLAADPTPRHRLSGRIGAEAEWRSSSGAVGGQLGVVGAGLVDLEGGQSAAVLPRALVLWRPIPAVALKLGLGGGWRPPDPTERFGNRGNVVGNPALRPERSWGGDLSVVYAPEFGPWTVHSEVALYGRHVEDGIFWRLDSQRRAVAANVGLARLLGVEGAVQLSRGDRFSAGLSVSAVDARNLSPDPAWYGRPLPSVPAFDLQLRVAAGPVDWLSFGGDLSLTAGNYWDVTGWYRAPTRSLVGAFVRGRVLKEGLWVGVEARNLGDQLAQVVSRNPLDPDDEVQVVQPVSDFVGYPLPGRTILLTLRWSAP